MIVKIFSPKHLAKILAFLTQNKAKLCKNLIMTLVFEKNAKFFAENRQKSQKIVIITSVPDWARIFDHWDCLLLGSFIENYRSSPNNWATFLYGKSYVCINLKTT
jgi:hypothetical protein